MASAKALRGGLVALLKCYPLKSGYSTVSHLKPLVRLTAEHEQCFARLRNGDRLLVDVSDFIGRTIYYLGDYDPKITWLCKRILGRGDTMLDVGANMGVVTGYASKIVGPEGHVHAFEPQPALAEWLRKSVEANGRGNVTVHAVALSDAEGELPLYWKPGNLGTASLGRDKDRRRRFLTVAPIRPSGDYLASLDLPPVRLLKVDVERHEERFFAGAETFLEQNAPQAIIFESLGNAPFFDRPVVRTLASLGYDFLRIPKAKFKMGLHRISRSETMDPVAGFDFLAIARGADMPLATAARCSRRSPQGRGRRTRRGF